MSDAPQPPAGYDPKAEERVSAAVAALGAGVVSWSDGRCVLGCPIRPAMLNRAGVLHGGVLATLLDTASGYAGTYCPYPGRRRVAATLSLTVNFLDAAGEGWLVTEARIVRAGRSVFFAEAAVALSGEPARGDEHALAGDAALPLLARASAVFKLGKGSDTLFGTPFSPDLSSN